MNYTLHHAVSTNGHRIPNRYEARDSEHRFICLLQRDPAGWRTWRGGRLFGSCREAVKSALGGTLKVGGLFG